MKHLRILSLIPFLLSFWFLGSSIAQPCISTFPYVESFEGPDSTGGWTTGVVPGNPNANLTTWVCNAPVATNTINSAAHGSYCWHTGWNNGGNTNRPNYVNGEQSYVMSPCFDFTGMSNPTFSAFVWWDLKNNDRVELQYSVNGGSWIRVGTTKSNNSGCAWYNWNDSLTSTAVPKPPATVHGFSGSGPNGGAIGGSLGWVRVQHSLKAAANQANVRLRFALRTDLANNANGFAFDSIIIKNTTLLDLMPGHNPNSRILCYGDTVTFDIRDIVKTNGYTLWTTKPGNVPFNGSQNPYLKVVDKAWYKVFAIDSTGFCYVDSAYVNANTLTVFLGNDKILCPGDSLTLAGGTGTTYSWHLDSVNTPSFSTSPSITVSQSGTYVQSITYQGCTLHDDINIAFEQVPDVDLLVEIDTICAGQSYLLNAGNAPLGTAYDWRFNGASTFTSQNVFVSSPGWYKVVITTPAAACQDSDSMYLHVNLPPVVDLGIDRYVCEPETITLPASPNIVYQWVPASYGNASQITYTPVAGDPPLFLKITATDEQGCTNSDSVILTPGVPPDAALGPDRILCDGSSVVLLPVNSNIPQSAFLWSTGASASSIIIEDPGTYVLTVTNPGGCTDSDTVDVSLEILQVNLGGDRFLCDSSSLVISAQTSTNNVNYLWNTSPPLTTSSIVVTQPGTYSVIATTPAGCIDQDTVNVAGLPSLTANFSFASINDTVILYQNVQFTDLSDAGVTSWNWHFGNGSTDVSTQQNPVHAFVALGTFTVTLTVSDGICTTTITKQVTVVLPVDEEAERQIGVVVGPNPNHGQFTVELELPVTAAASLNLLNMSGQEVWQLSTEEAQNHHIGVDAAHLPAGLYVLKVATASGTVYRKVVIN